MAPPRTVGPTGCTASSSDVTTPKFPPPPRNAQNSSGFSSAAARTTWASALTSSAEMRLSQREAVLAYQVPDPAAERESSQSGRRNQSASRRQAVELGLAVELLPGRAALCSGAARAGVDMHRTHLGEVDDETVVAGRESGDAMGSATYRDGQPFAPGEAYGGDHICGAGSTARSLRDIDRSRGSMFAARSRSRHPRERSPFRRLLIAVQRRSHPPALSSWSCGHLLLTPIYVKEARCPPLCNRLTPRDGVRDCGKALPIADPARIPR